MSVPRPKTGFSLLATVFAALSCGSDITEPSHPDGLRVAASVTTATATFTVPPSGGDDTGALQAAFDAAVAAGPGSLVQLEAGTYCLMGPIIVRGFDGYWKGAGRDETIIQTCQDPFPVPVDVIIDPAYPADPPFALRNVFQFAEVEGRPPTNLHVSDLTIQVNGVTNPYFRHGIPSNLFGAAISVVGFRPTVVDFADISEATLSVHSVAIHGSPGGSQPVLLPTNLTAGAVMAGAVETFSLLPDDISELKYEGMQATVSVTRSHFDHLALGMGLFLGDCQSCASSVVIGGSQPNGNTFDFLSNPLFRTAISGGTLEFSHNRISNSNNVAVVIPALQKFFGLDGPPQPDSPLPDLADYVFAHNEVDLAPFLGGGGNGIELDDLPFLIGGTADQAINALVTNNKIHSSNPSVFAAVDGFPANEVLVTSNKITGDYRAAGIALGYFSFPGRVSPESNWMIKGNNLRGATVALTAPIFLGPFSSDNTVVGGSNKTDVRDVGVNNILTGVNNMGGGIGQDVKDAMERKREMLGSGSLP